MQNPTQAEIVSIWEEHSIYCAVDGEGDSLQIRAINSHRGRDVDSVCHLIPLAKTAQEISFESSDISTKGFAFLKGHPNVEFVEIDDTELPGASYELLTTLPKLRRLGCSPRWDTDVAMMWIGKLTKLTKLRIRKAKIRDSDLTSISHLSELTDFEVSHCNVDSGLAVIAQFPKIKKLILSFTDVSSVTLKSVAQITAIEELYLEGVTVDDIGIDNISGLRSLQVLALRGDKVTHVGLEHLTRCQSIRSLHIDDLVLSHRMITSFMKLPKLKLLWLNGATASETDAKSLKQALPDCDVEFFTDLEDPSSNNDEAG